MHVMWLNNTSEMCDGGEKTDDHKGHWTEQYHNVSTTKWANDKSASVQVQVYAC